VIYRAHGAFSRNRRWHTRRRRNPAAGPNHPVTAGPQQMLQARPQVQIRDHEFASSPEKSTHRSNARRPVSVTPIPTTPSTEPNQMARAQVISP
jgi:hypothetical protein